MPLPTVEVPWQYSLGVDLGALSWRLIFINIKNALKSFALNPWVVKGSSNSIVAAMDGVDRWAVVGDLVATAGAGARSWIVLRNAAAAELLVHLHPIASAEGQQYHLLFSAAAGFTGGTTTARPTAADETAADGSNVWYWTGGAGAVNRGQFLHSFDGRETRALFSGSGGVGYLGAWLIGEVANAHASFTKRAYCVFDTFISVNGSLYEVETNGRGVMIATPSAGRRGKVVIESSYTAAPPGGVNEHQSVVNEISLEYQMVPLWLATGTTPWAFAGRIKDVWAGPRALAVGTTYPNSAAREFAQFGSLIVPWDGSVPVVV